MGYIKNLHPVVLIGVEAEGKSRDGPSGTSQLLRSRRRDGPRLRPRGVRMIRNVFHRDHREFVVEGGKGTRSLDGGHFGWARDGEDKKHDGIDLLNDVGDPVRAGLSFGRICPAKYS